MLIYSNDSSGETINFKFYDSQSDTIFDIIQTHNFVSDMIEGNVIEPIEFTFDL